MSVGSNEQTIKDYKTLNAKVQGSKLTKTDSVIVADQSEDNANKTTITVKKTVSVSLNLKNIEYLENRMFQKPANAKFETVMHNLDAYLIQFYK